MDKIKRIIILFSLSLMAAAAFLPIWRIEIWAPQYPEGLLMQIKLNAMSGNIDQVNILNHYVGMKHIIPDDIRELHFVPPVFAALLALGLLAWLANRVRILQAWFGAMVLASFLGILDLYLWGYDYGHNLNPLAPIKIPGMSYQPPLVGHKTLLNIDSYSLPDVGGYMMVVSMGCIFIVLFGDIFWQRLGYFGSRRGPR